MQLYFRRVKLLRRSRWLKSVVIPLPPSWLQRAVATPTPPLPLPLPTPTPHFHQAARKKCTAMETEELRRASAWKPAEMELKWDWGTKTFDVFLSHKVRLMG